MTIQIQKAGGFYKAFHKGNARVSALGRNPKEAEKKLNSFAGGKIYGSRRNNEAGS